MLSRDKPLQLLIELLYAHTRIPEIRCPVDKQSIAGGGVERVQYIDLPLRKLLPHLLRRNLRGIDAPGNAAGKRDVEKVPAL